MYCIIVTGQDLRCPKQTDLTRRAFIRQASKAPIITISKYGLYGGAERKITFLIRDHKKLSVRFAYLMQ